MADEPSFDQLAFNSDGFISRAKLAFPNGYTASVVRGTGTYGAEDGLYELAVMAKNGLCYDTPITSDVEGYLTPDAVTDLLKRIADLPQRDEVEAA